MASIFNLEYPFYKGNLHTHTTASDGRKTLREMRDIYAALEYDFVAVTDHNAFSPQDDTARPLLLGGIELDYDYNGELVHIVGAALEEEPSRGQTPQQGISGIKKAGGVAILAHPAWSLNSTDFMARIQGLTAAEVYNSVTGFLPRHPRRADSSLMLDCALARGARYGFVASDDTHYYQGEQGRGFTMVNACACTQPALREALVAGRYYASQGPRIYDIDITGDTLTVTCSPARAVWVLSNLHGGNLRGVQGEGVCSFEYTILPTERFLRVEMEDENGLRAWSRPIFLSL